MKMKKVTQWNWRMVQMIINSAICPCCFYKIKDLEVSSIAIQQNMIEFYLMCPKCGGPFKLQSEFQFTSQKIRTFPVKTEKPTS